MLTQMLEVLGKVRWCYTEQLRVRLKLCDSMIEQDNCAALKQVRDTAYPTMQFTNAYYSHKLSFVFTTLKLLENGKYLKQSQDT
jgi:hypothetical protein